MNIYKYLVDNNLLEEFLNNFSINRKIQGVQNKKVNGDSYYIDKDEKIPLNVYEYQYDIKTFYSVFDISFCVHNVVYGYSSCRDEIPFKKTGKYNVDYDDLTGYETSSYLKDGSKNIMSKYGRSGLFDLPSNLKDVFKDKKFCLFLYYFYLYVSDRNKIDRNVIYKIYRLIEINDELISLKNEKDEILNILGKDLVL